MKRLYTLSFMALFAATGCNSSFNKTLTCTNEIKSGTNIEMVMVYTQDEIISYTLMGDNANEENIKKAAKKLGSEAYAIEMKVTLESSGYYCALRNTK